ncbi:hypothetical protein Q8A73_017933 [Channa argus]|nr:hypothetical protein Q8A73_017933 [Channa argus]
MRNLQLSGRLQVKPLLSASSPNTKHSSPPPPPAKVKPCMSDHHLKEQLDCAVLEFGVEWLTDSRASQSLISAACFTPRRFSKTTRQIEKISGQAARYSSNPERPPGEEGVGCPQCQLDCRVLLLQSGVDARRHKHRIDAEKKRNPSTNNTPFWDKTLLLDQVQSESPVDSDLLLSVLISLVLQLLPSQLDSVEPDRVSQPRNQLAADTDLPPPPLHLPQDPNGVLVLAHGTAVGCLVVTSITAESDTSLTILDLMQQDGREEDKRGDAFPGERLDCRAVVAATRTMESSYENEVGVIDWVEFMNQDGPRSTPCDIFSCDRRLCETACDSTSDLLPPSRLFLVTLIPESLRLVSRARKNLQREGEGERKSEDVKRAVITDLEALVTFPSLILPSCPTKRRDDEEQFTGETNTDLNTRWLRKSSSFLTARAELGWLLSITTVAYPDVGSGFLLMTLPRTLDPCLQFDVKVLFVFHTLF